MDHVMKLDDQSSRYTKGRRNHLKACSNAEVDDVSSFQPFGNPRGPAPVDGYLQVTQIDMLMRNNKANHKTVLYSNPLLIVRRGQEFSVQISFNRAYKPGSDRFQLEFRIGGSPQIDQNTTIIVSPNPGENTSWQGRLLQSPSRTILMGITPAAACIVGKYRMYVVVITPAGLVRDMITSQELYILFNPWAADDTVFMSNESELSEYILNQTGIIYNGDNNTPIPRPWNFGQFESGILDACLLVMDDATIPLSSRGDPVIVSRQASARLNSTDNINGVLVGNWSDNFSDGYAPTSWTGSVKILRSYAQGRKPVRYGQCWVFAGIFNTFLRCVGIPSRVITNFNSAHDHGGSLITHIYVNQNGETDKVRTTDSIWNFHCWNEAYMTRPDLPVGFGGWQAVDCTPQETSDGMYRCGPVSISANKRGIICYSYDAPFVFSEVESEVVVIEEEPNGDDKVLQVNQSYVGSLILTKEIGQDTLMDITYTYKYPPGSTEQQMAMATAQNYGSASNRSALPKEDVEIKVLAENTMIGKDFKLNIQFKNLGRSVHNIDAVVAGNVIYYTGVLGPKISDSAFSVNLEPLKTVVKYVEVNAKDYMSKLLDQGNLSFFVRAKIKEMGQVISTQSVVTLQGPKLTIEVTGNLKVKQKMYFTVKFTNTLKYDLTKITVTMEGAVVFASKTKEYSHIASMSSITWTESFTPTNEGPNTLIACLDCALLRQVHGWVNFTIQP
ncbi:coagulation factor XIII A chain-like [Brienomyrus brachyistius]|uniref:coagulation factor XIII A chain-like n=1 Tax=Brienomyrus brachyistius TaxID=42636 RepID=UPI0020B1C8E2|nr:coagulation factor XIII A chain-like [Brienomyrus brachyistius]